MTTKRRFATSALSAFCAGTLLLSAALCAGAGTLGGPLVLADEGSFFVNGKVVATNFPSAPVVPPGPGHITVDQMYVHYWIPQKVSGPAVIMVHGAGHTGVTYETTPDGREGWATYFVRKGFPVYVVDHSGRGRSGFNSTAINQAKVESNPSLLPNISLATRENGWVNFLFGPAYGTAWPDEQFPVQALDQYTAQLVPNGESTLEGTDGNTIDALAALVDKIGPAVLLVHSQSGSYGMEMVRRRPALVRALVNVEGNCVPLGAADPQGAFAKVPVLSLWGDHSVGAAGFNGDTRRNGCIQTVATIKAANGPAQFLLLPDIGIKGNSHMMMMDKNNLQIADIIIKWIGSAVKP
jgi:pimeloyl-ACP methyl ester carboxylesterase